MKTNRNARALARIRLSLTLLALVGFVGFELGLGTFLARRLGPTTGPGAGAAPAVDVTLGALVDAAR